MNNLQTGKDTFARNGALVFEDCVTSITLGRDFPKDFFEDKYKPRWRDEAILIAQIKVRAGFAADSSFGEIWKAFPLKEKVRQRYSLNEAVGLLGQHGEEILTGKEVVENMRQLNDRLEELETDELIDLYNRWRETSAIVEPTSESALWYHRRGEPIPSSTLYFLALESARKVICARGYDLKRYGLERETPVALLRHIKETYRKITIDLKDLFRHRDLPVDISEDHINEIQKREKIFEEVWDRLSYTRRIDALLQRSRRHIHLEGEKSNLEEEIRYLRKKYLEALARHFPIPANQQEWITHMETNIEEFERKLRRVSDLLADPVC